MGLRARGLNRVWIMFTPNHGPQFKPGQRRRERSAPRPTFRAAKRCNRALASPTAPKQVRSFFFFITLGLELSDTKVYKPEIRALLGTASHYCEAVVLKSRTVPNQVRLVRGSSGSNADRIEGDAAGDGRGGFEEGATRGESVHEEDVALEVSPETIPFIRSPSSLNSNAKPQS